MRKSRILTFLFSLFPGAGHMYLGYMKRGVSLMGAFWVILGIAGMLQLEIFLFILPIIWFYSFFDAMNIRSMHYEFLPHDDFLFHLDSLFGINVMNFFRRRHILSGVLLILIGVYSLIKSWVSPLFYYVFSIDIYPFIRTLPNLLLAVVLIWFGIHLLKSGSPHKYLEDDYKEYRDADNSNNSDI